MDFTNVLNQFESISFQRLLRRNVVGKAVLVGRAALNLAAGLLVLLLAYQIYQSYQATSSQLGEFEKRLLDSSPALGEAEGDKSKPPDFAVIHQRAIFGPLGIAPTPKPQAATKAGAATQFVLIGTFVSKGQEAFAIIEEQKKKTQDVFLLKDPVFGEATLTAILSDRVELLRNGQTEILTLDATPDTPSSGEGGISAAAGDEYVVDEAEIDKALENLPLLLTQARAVPYFREGRAVGLRLFAIRGGSLFEKIGLQNGDVLKSVNSNSLADLSQAMQLFQKLKEERSIAVVLERNSAERTFRYQIK